MLLLVNFYAYQSESTLFRLRFKGENEQAMLHAQNKSDEKAIKNLMFTLPGTSIPLSQRTESKQEKLFWQKSWNWFTNFFFHWQYFLNFFKRKRKERNRFDYMCEIHMNIITFNKRVDSWFLTLVSKPYCFEKKILIYIAFPPTVHTRLILIRCLDNF